MQCRVKLFARARDLAGAAEVSVALPDAATVADLRRVLASAYPALAGLLKRSALAVDNEFADETLKVPPGAEIQVRRGTTPVRLARAHEAPFTDRLVAKFDLPVLGWRGAAERKRNGTGH